MVNFGKLIFLPVVISFFVILQSTLVSSRVENFMSCEPQGNIKFINKDNKRVNIYGVKIDANFNDNQEIFAKNDPDYYYFNINRPGIDYNLTKQPVRVDFSINHVRFTGFVRPDDEVVKEKTHAEYITYVSAAAQYRKNTDLLIMDGVPTNLHLNKRHCSVGILRQNHPLQENYFTDDEVEKVVLDLIESCIVSHVCDNIDRDDDLLKYKNPYNIQTSINKIADKIAPSLIQSLIQPNTRLPDISGTYAIVTSYQGTNVSVINTPDIERASDMKLTHEGDIYTIAGDFRFHNLNFHIEDFQVSAPTTSSTGVTDLHLSRLTVAIEVQMNYTDPDQCKTSLKDLDIYDYGTITVNRPNSKEDSYIGFLLPSFSMNNESSTLIDSIIISEAHYIATNILNDKLTNVDCNDFNYFIPFVEV